MRDVTFHSAALERDVTYRVILPAHVEAGKRLPAVYVLHGGGADFHSWSNDSDVARFAEQGFILVMPEGASSYYVNAARRPRDRYEDYVVHDLIGDVESRFPASHQRQDRAIAGVSMGGFGAITLSLKHPDLFIFAAGLSPAIDVPTRPFSWHRWGQWRRYRAIFGPWNGQYQRNNDPFVLAQRVDPAKAPYFFITCGEQEGLLPANRKFATLLAQRQFKYEFHAVPGGHNWNQWNARLDEVFSRLNSIRGAGQGSAR
jgi:S-formylglutathione hydrolase FrmB